MTPFNTIIYSIITMKKYDHIKFLLYVLQLDIVMVQTT